MNDVPNPANANLLELEKKLSVLSRDHDLSEADVAELYRIASESAKSCRRVVRERDELAGEVETLRHELAHVEFDRACLADELQQQLDKRSQPVLGPTPDDLQGAAMKQQLEHAARCLLDLDDYLVERLKKAGVPEDRKIVAVKIIRFETGWSLAACKRWVEANYFRPS